MGEQRGPKVALGPLESLKSDRRPTKETEKVRKRDTRNNGRFQSMSLRKETK